MSNEPTVHSDENGEYVFLPAGGPNDHVFQRVSLEELGYDPRVTEDAVSVGNRPDPSRAHEMYLAAVNRRTRPRTTHRPNPRRLAIRRAALYATRRAQVAQWAEDSFRADILADLNSDRAADWKDAGF